MRAVWRGTRQRWKNLAGVSAFALFVGILPLFLRTPYFLSTMVLVGLYTLVVIGLCLLMGYAGQISLGQSAFYGLGAYGSAILCTRFHWSPWLAMVAAAVGTGFVAYLIGVPIFRLRGHYLAMGTLAFGYIVHIVINEWTALTRGPSGLAGIPRLRLGDIVFKADLAYYYLVWGVALIGIILALNLVHSRFGRALRALRDSEEAAESLGVRVGRCKLKALVISAVYASVAGSLYAHYMIYVSPGICSLDASIGFVLMAVVGGLGSVWGAPLGAAVVMFLTLGLREIVPLFTHHGSGEHQIIAYGALLVLLMIYMPEGVGIALARAWRRLDWSLVRGRLQRRWRRER